MESESGSGDASFWKRIPDLSIQMRRRQGSCIEEEPDEVRLYGLFPVVLLDHTAGGSIKDGNLKFYCFAGNSSGNQPKDNNVSLARRNEALRKYELLTELENHLSSILSKQRQVNLKESGSQSLLRQESVDDTKQEGNIMNMSSSHSQGESVSLATEYRLRSPFDLKSRSRKDRRVDIVPAWSSAEASSDVILTDQPSNSECEEVRSDSISNGGLQSSLCQASSSGKSVAFLGGYWENIVMCLQGRERGFSWPLACSSGGYAGRNREKWIPFLEGWKSIGKQFHGPAVYFKRRCFTSWIPTWCAYTSSVAVVQPPGGADVCPN
ncbi:uncharacterized protein LOC122078081 [Macadamia integrifolia]|uniref:uncharacterized protein LOC122078081 n=1 Tax=Macadamia integrifolia TaxID=60698 RepID=UPI001C4E5051|nr:uncharacterized protein LOC122078081 [Macadamia integrifolia]